MSEECADAILRDAYESLEWEMVPVHDNLEVPSATSAMFRYVDGPSVTDAEEIADRINDMVGLSFIDVLPQNGEHWYEFHVSGQLWNDNANERLNVAISTTGARFHKRGHDVAFETFERAVRAVETATGATLEYEENDD